MEPPRLPPRCAERYETVRLIGRGGYGAVWLARDRELDRAVALKVLRGRAASDPALVERFVHEAAVTARLSSPHIVRMWEHGLDDGVPWIAFEYLGETSLAELLERHGRLPVEAALEAVDQVGAALDEAHAHGVLHRDLKPDNVIAAGPGLYKLIDFGVAGGQRNGRYRTDVNFIMGTPAYLAPEQIRCMPASETTDQYQLGLLAHHLLTGRLPHDDRPLPRMLGRRSVEPVGSLRALEPMVPDSVDAAVRRMLATDPAGRFGSVKEARGALREAGARVTEPRPRTPTLIVRARAEREVRITRVAPLLRVVAHGRGAENRGWTAGTFVLGAVTAAVVHALASVIVRLF